MRYTFADLLGWNKTRPNIVWGTPEPSDPPSDSGPPPPAVSFTGAAAGQFNADDPSSWGTTTSNEDFFDSVNKGSNWDSSGNNTGGISHPTDDDPAWNASDETGVHTGMTYPSDAGVDSGLGSSSGSGSGSGTSIYGVDPTLNQVKYDPNTGTYSYGGESGLSGDTITAILTGDYSGIDTGITGIDTSWSDGGGSLVTGGATGGNDDFFDSVNTGSNWDDDGGNTGGVTSSSDSDYGSQVDSGSSETTYYSPPPTYTPPPPAPPPVYYDLDGVGHSSLSARNAANEAIEAQRAKDALIQDTLASAIANTVPGAGGYGTSGATAEQIQQLYDTGQTINFEVPEGGARAVALPPGVTREQDGFYAFGTKIADDTWLAEFENPDEYGDEYFGTLSGKLGHLRDLAMLAGSGLTDIFDPTNPYDQVSQAASEALIDLYTNNPNYNYDYDIDESNTFAVSDGEIVTPTGVKGSGTFNNAKEIYLNATDEEKQAIKDQVMEVTMISEEEFNKLFEEDTATVDQSQPVVTTDILSGLPDGGEDDDAGGDEDFGSGQGGMGFVDTPISGGGGGDLGLPEGGESPLSEGVTGSTGSVGAQTDLESLSSDTSSDSLDLLDITSDDSDIIVGTGDELDFTAGDDSQPNIDTASDIEVISTGTGQVGVDENGNIVVYGTDGAGETGTGSDATTTEGTATGEGEGDETGDDSGIMSVDVAGVGVGSDEGIGGLGDEGVGLTGGEGAGEAGEDAIIISGGTGLEGSGDEQGSGTGTDEGTGGTGGEGSGEGSGEGDGDGEGSGDGDGEGDGSGDGDDEGGGEVDEEDEPPFECPDGFKAVKVRGNWACIKEEPDYKGYASSGRGVRPNIRPYYKPVRVKSNYTPIKIGKK
jgi:hypothetical protein